MAEDTEKQVEFTASRNLKKAMMRNTAQGDSLKKDLKFIQGERMKLMHSWEQKKQAFVRQKLGKLPIIRLSVKDTEKRDTKKQLSEDSSRTNSRVRFNMYGSQGVHGRNQLSPKHSGHEDKAELYTVLGDRKSNISCMSKLTVKDLSRILSPDKNFSAAIISDAYEIQSVASSSTPRRLQHRLSNLYINKEPAIRNDSSSPACSTRTPIQQRPGYYRALSVSPYELNQTQESKMTSGYGSSSIQLRKRASTWSPKQNNLTTVSKQNDSASKNLHQVREKVQC